MRKYEYNHVLVARNRLFNLFINHFLTSLCKILRIYKSNYLTNYNDSEEVQEMKLASIYMKNPNPSFSFALSCVKFRQSPEGGLTRPNNNV